MQHETSQHESSPGLRGVQRGWLVHATVYLAVNLLLVLLALAAGRTPMFGHALAWGIGLAIHGLVALLVPAAARPALRA